MAIPFEVSTGDDLDQLFARLYEILEQIHRITRQRARQSSSYPRVRLPNNIGRCHPDGQGQINCSHAIVSDVVGHPTLLSSPAGQCLEAAAVLQPRELLPSRRRRGCNTSSESSCCCGEDKFDNASSGEDDGHQVWTRVGVPILKLATDLEPDKQLCACKEENRGAERSSKKKKSSQSESIFSKLVPDLSSKSIWTAVICVVGWHLLRTR